MSGGEPNGGQGFGGGEQGERLEGSLTDGGAVPGKEDEEDRSFGAGRGIDVEGADVPQPEAGPSGEQSGYGNTPPR